MVSISEAEGLTYLEYKRLVWSRLATFWRSYQADHPERATFVTERLRVCDGHAKHWAAAA